MAEYQNVLQRERARTKALEGQLASTQIELLRAKTQALWADDAAYRLRRRKALDAAPLKPKRPQQSAKRAAFKRLPEGGIVLKDITDSAVISSWYRRELQTLVREMAGSMLYHVRAAFNRGDSPLAMDESLTVALRRVLAKWGRRWRRKIEALAKGLAEEFAIRSRRDYDERLMKALRDAGMTVKFQPTAAMKEGYRAVLEENVSLIKSIPQQFLKDVESSVWVGVMRGGDMEYISQALQKNYGVSYRRAALIARDQEAKARAVIERARRLELGVTQAIWRHSHAGVHPRRSHVAMDGKTYDIAKGMWDPEVGRYILPGELVGCRCTSRAIIE